MTQSSLRLILFTMQPPPMVNTLIETFEALGHSVVLVVTSRGRKSRPFSFAPYIVASLPQGLDVLVTSQMHRLPAMLSELAPDLIFTAGFSFRFSPELLVLPCLGCVNAHFSLLPKYRGPSAFFWQLMNGETQGGVTFHRMDSDFDTGPILVQRALDITPDDDAKSLWDKLLELEVSMLPEMLSLVATGAPGTPQPQASASYAPSLGAAEQQLDWTRPATHLHNQIRALAWTGVQASVDGQAIRVQRARVVASSQDWAEASPGTLLACTSEGMLVQTGQDALLITEYTPEDQIRIPVFGLKQ